MIVIPAVLSGVLACILIVLFGKWSFAPRTSVINKNLVIGGIMAAISSVLVLLIYGAISSNTVLMVISGVLSLALVTGLANDIRMPKAVYYILHLIVPLPLLALSVPLWQAYMLLPIMLLTSRWKDTDGLDASSMILTLIPVLLIVLDKSLIDGSVIGLVMLASLLALWWFCKPPSKFAAGNSAESMTGAVIGILIIMTQAWYALVVFIPHLIDFFFQMRKIGVTRMPFLEHDKTISTRNQTWYSLTDFFIVSLKKIKGTVYPFDILAIYSITQAVIGAILLAVYYKILF